MPDLRTFIRILKRSDLIIREDFGQKSDISKWLEAYSNEFDSYEVYAPFCLFPFLRPILSFFCRPKYKIGEIISVNISRRILPNTIIEYLNNCFIVTNTPKGLKSYKLYEIAPFGTEGEWESVKVSEDFIDRG